MLRYTGNKYAPLITKRFLFVPSNSLTDTKKRKRIPIQPRVKSVPQRNENIARWQRQKDPYKGYKKPGNATTVTPRQELKELRSIVREVSDYIHPRDKDALTRVEKPVPTDLPKIDIDEATDDIFEELSGDGHGDPSQDVAGGVPTSLTFPESVNKRLGLVSDLCHLSVAASLPERVEHIEWKTTLSQLQESGGFKRLPHVDVKAFVNKIPHRTLRHLIPTIEQMYQEANIPIHYNTYFEFIKALSLGNILSKQEVEVIEEYLEEIERQTKLKKSHYEVMIGVYVKNNNTTKIEGVLLQMKANNILLTRVVYESILKKYVYYDKDHKKALEVFDSMKFLSKGTAPDAGAYADIMKSCVTDHNVEKALDLYQEMQDKLIQPNEQVLATLAMGCAKTRLHRTQAWDFLFQIYDRGWTPTLATFETMLQVSARDGDLELTRAIFYKAIETRSVTPTAFVALMMAYSKYVLSTERETPYLISLTEKGRLFKQNITGNVDFRVPVNNFPFLPSSEIHDAKFVLAESSAVWAYAMMHNSKLVSHPYAAASYLEIAINFGKFEDFRDRFDASTYLDTDGIPKVREIEIMESEPEPQEQTESDESEVQVEAGKSNEVVKSPILEQIQSQTKDNRFKAPRTSRIYDIAITAAGKFQNYEFAERIIAERGQFRKSNKFKELSQKQQKQEDFGFAAKLIQCYIDMWLLEDAYAVVLLTAESFPWSWKELGPLSAAAVNLGSLELAAAIRKIVLGEQVRHEGKIKRKDYKDFVRKRGY
ncbi:Mitochondrial group I intron splicing factor CCM1 [Candida viswanathii]|uniref:Mitochondrial 15S rRNA processing factor CCM1 n=1 Tax=Candida viswanathii TaxID=5486 RepID=A0A367XQJ6_9ASCO|nr:Mitochondrial group I intron splicing factor CCM1 [Candida viswanathii]